MKILLFAALCCLALARRSPLDSSRTTTVPPLAVQDFRCGFDKQSIAYLFHGKESAKCPKFMMHILNDCCARQHACYQSRTTFNSKGECDRFVVRCSVQAVEGRGILRRNRKCLKAVREILKVSRSRVGEEFYRNVGVKTRGKRAAGNPTENGAVLPTDDEVTEILNRNTEADNNGTTVGNGTFRNATFSNGTSVKSASDRLPCKPSGNVDEASFMSGKIYIEALDCYVERWQFYLFGVILIIVLIAVLYCVVPSRGEEYWIKRFELEPLHGSF